VRQSGEYSEQYLDDQTSACVCFFNFSPEPVLEERGKDESTARYRGANLFEEGLGADSTCWFKVRGERASTVNTVATPDLSLTRQREK
jgi:hypothetical protein